MIGAKKHEEMSMPKGKGYGYKAAGAIKAGSSKKRPSGTSTGHRKSGKKGY